MSRRGDVVSFFDMFRIAMFSVVLFLLIGFLRSVSLWGISVSPASEEPMTCSEAGSQDRASRRSDPEDAGGSRDCYVTDRDRHDRDVGRDLPSLAGGRPLIIDYFASRHAGLTVGDISVGFTDAVLEARYVEILPVAGVRILAERNLIGLLAAGASLVWAPHLIGRHLAIRLARPERWIAFLETHPGNR